MWLLLVPLLILLLLPLHVQGSASLATLLGPERLAALLPKLYRLTHDPSPKVRHTGGCMFKHCS
jgi:hypothetical protein